MSLLKLALPKNGEAVLINQKRDALTLTVDGFSIVTFDRAGRWIGAFLDGKNYKRGIDNRVMEKWAYRNDDGAKIRQRRDLGDDEKKALAERLYGLAGHVRNAMQQGEALVVGQPMADPATWDGAIAWLGRVSTWDDERLREERGRFLQVYKPITILPPDQYLALVLQITEGCTYNRCTFCDFYRDRPFRVKPIPEVQNHISQVKDLLRNRLGLRHVIFLADANALVAPTDYLVEVFQLINQSFDLTPSDLAASEIVAWRETHPHWFRGIYSFLEVFTGHHKRVEDFAVLRELGLQRVYVGLETGDPALLTFLNKPGSIEQARDLIHTLHGAGVHVGIIVLVGAGGDQFAGAHVENTALVLNSLNLGRDDLVYLSEFVEHPGSEYAQRAARAGIRPLSKREMRDQMEEMRARFRFDPQNRPKVAPYDIQEFIY